MNEYFSKRYHRHKRIRRIISLQNGDDGYRPRRWDSDAWFLLPRYTWMRFFATLILMMILSFPVSYIFDVLFMATMGAKVKTLLTTPVSMLVGFLAVEIIDDWFLRWEQGLERFRKTVFPFIAFFVLVIAFVLIKNPTDVKRVFGDWQKTVNEELQSTPVAIVAMPTQGLNWRLLFDSPNHLKRVSFEEASQFCSAIGKDWQMYDGSPQFIAKPNPRFDRPFYVWQMAAIGQIDGDGIFPPKVFEVAQPNSRASALCINKRIR